MEILVQILVYTFIALVFMWGFLFFAFTCSMLALKYIDWLGKKLE